VLELAELIWRKINLGKAFEYVCDPPFKYDVRRRVPSVEKARRVLGIEAATTLDEMLDEVIPWVAEAIRNGQI